jgi:hypothetical protein
VGDFTVYQLFLSAASIADLFFLLRSRIAPECGVIDAREAPSDLEHHGQDIRCDQLGMLCHHAEGAGEGQDRRPYLQQRFNQVPLVLSGSRSPRAAIG